MLYRYELELSEQFTKNDQVVSLTFIVLPNKTSQLLYFHLLYPFIF